MTHADKFAPYQDGIYLLNHSVGLPPKSAREQASQRYFALWEKSGGDVWPEWLQQIDGFRSALGTLLNGDYQDFCPQTNLSSALTKVLHSLPRQPGRDTILLNEQDFPSMGFVVSMARHAGFKIRHMPATADALDINSWDSHLTGDCCCVLVTHVHSNTSTKVPVAEICQLAQQKGVISIVDIAQSVGVVPINLTDWQADFVLGSCVKWLCGGPGAGFLWANPDIIEQCQPRDVGWFSHADPFEFDIHNFRYAEGVLRFWGGTPSVAPYVIAANSIDTMNSIGIDTIRQHNCRLNQRVLDRLAPGVALCPTQQEQRGGTLVLNFAVQQAAVVQRLTEARVQFDARPTGVRMSPHIYNSDAEIDQVIDCLASAGGLP